MAGNGSEPRRSVISKVVAIVRSFDSGGSLTVTEIAQVADLPLSTVHRLAHELAAWGILHRRDDARFEAALRARCASPRDRPPDLRELAAPTVDDLYAVTKNDVRLGVLDGPRVSYVEKTDGSRPLSDFSDAAKLPAHATALGRALLAHSPAETVDHLIRYGLRSYTSSTVATAARLRHALKPRPGCGGSRSCAASCCPTTPRSPFPSSDPTGEAVAALEVRLRDVSFGAALRCPRAHGCGSRTVPRSRTSRRAPGAGASRDAGRGPPHRWFCGTHTGRSENSSSRIGRRR